VRHGQTNLSIVSSDGQPTVTRWCRDSKPRRRRTASNLVKMPQNFGSSAKVLRKPPPALSVSDAPLDARSARQLRSMFSRLVDAMALSGIPDSLFPE
jgi:hypothetical protein